MISGSAILFVFALIAANMSFAENIEVVTFEYYPITNSDSTGINPHIVKAAFQEIGDTVSFRFYPRKRAMKVFRDATNLLFLGEVRYFPDISSELDAQKFIHFRVGLIYKKDRFPSLVATDIEKMKGSIIGVSFGSNLTPVFKKAGWKVEEAKRLEYNLRKLMADRIDFWGTVDLTGISLVEKIFPDQVKNIEIWSLERFPLELVAKKNSVSGKMLQRFRMGFGEIIENGAYREILEEYYGQDVPPPVPVLRSEVE